MGVCLECSSWKDCLRTVVNRRISGDAGCLSQSEAMDNASCVIDHDIRLGTVRGNAYTVTLYSTHIPVMETC